MLLYSCPYNYLLKICPPMASVFGMLKVCIIRMCSHNEGLVLVFVKEESRSYPKLSDTLF